MRKIIYTILFILLLSFGFSVNAQASGPYNNLKALGITAQEAGISDMSTPATRAELAYFASKLTDGKSYEDSETAFSDVTNQTKLTGYINNAYNLGILNGKSADVFAPDGYVTVDAAYKVFTIVSGYSQFAEMSGGYPEGYRKAAMMLGFSGYFKTNSEGYVTAEGLFDGAEALLGNEHQKYVFSVQNGEVTYNMTSEKQSILTEVHGINVYSGVITGINDGNFSADVKIVKSKFETNKVHYSSGKTLSFYSNKNINLYELENAPVTIWIDSDKKILNAVLERGVEIKFATIDAVNSDTNELNEYKADYIDYISLANDTKNYHTTDNFKVRYNLSDTNIPVSLVNKFAKIVFLDNKIEFIEAWELTEGGLITNVSDDYIVYTQGDVLNKRITDISTLNRVMVYFNDRGTDLGDLKTDTYFDYFRLNDQLVIVASEKRVTDVFKAVGTKEVQIGNGLYSVSDVYVQASTGIYHKNGSYANLYNKSVTAYFDAKGYCRYIGLTDLTQLKSGRFLGIILGSRSTDIFDENVELKVLSLEEEKEPMILKLKDNCALSCGKTKTEILAIEDTTYAANVFEFIVNSKNEITEIKSPEIYYGFTTGKTTVSQFPYDGTAYAKVDGKIMYFTNAKIHLLLKDADDQPYIKIVKWTDIYGRRAANKDVYLTFYGNGMSSEFRLVLVSGNTEGIYSRTSSTAYARYVSTVSNADGEQLTRISLFKTSSTEYNVTSDVVSKIAAGNADGSKSISGRTYYVGYDALYYDTDNKIKINSSVCVDDIMANPGDHGWKKATVYKSDSQRLFIEGNPIQAIFYFSCTPIKILEDGTIKTIATSDIPAGATVYYKESTSTSRGGGITALIVE